MAKTTSVPTLEENIKDASDKFLRAVDGGSVTTAKEADERAADIAGNYGYESGSDEEEALLSALFALAGREFPGEWASYKRS